MSMLTVNDFPLGQWRQHDTARCPQDGGRVELKRYLKAKPVGTFSLAGNQIKFSARELWESRCTTCDWAAPAEPK